MNKDNLKPRLNDQSTIRSMHLLIIGSWLYRQVKEDDIRKLENNSPVMGLYAGLHQMGSGVVRIGDPIYVNED
ncbi:hypothetical protein J6590_036613 [Homalodisca vitripennis]|nr:hypothetical protein J6590_036613 [Homalodisca vitripennis]